jgi:FKBP-type peptidyl-prolyl cis-trans isomerase
MFRIIQNGYGKRPQPTDTVKVYYTGKLINGVIFDGTSPGLPASFKLNSVIPGWIEALQLMREGDHWQLVIPANLGYGVRGQGDGLIPPNQTLIFDLKLLGTTPAPRRGDKDYRPEPGDEEQQ